jgi:hypothetical protein
MNPDTETLPVLHAVQDVQKNVERDIAALKQKMDSSFRNSGDVTIKIVEFINELSGNICNLTNDVATVKAWARQALAKEIENVSAAVARRTARNSHAWYQHSARPRKRIGTGVKRDRKPAHPARPEKGSASRARFHWSHNRRGGF